MPAKQPINLIVQKGKKHLTKEEIEVRQLEEVVAKTDQIKPPKFLKKSLHKEFDFLSSELLEIGIMTNLDCDTLGQYIIAKDLYSKFTKKVNKLVNTDEEFGKLQYYVKLQSKYFEQAMACAKEMGLTISARCKLIAPTKKKEEKQNKFQKFREVS